MAEGHAAFVGSIPTTYERLLVPLVFAEPARRLAAAVLATHPRDILETCASTGVLTRQLAVDGSAYITATDLSAIDTRIGALLGVIAPGADTRRSVDWRWVLVAACVVGLQGVRCDTVGCGAL